MKNIGERTMAVQKLRVRLAHGKRGSIPLLSSSSPLQFSSGNFLLGKFLGGLSLDKFLHAHFMLANIFHFSFNGLSWERKTARRPLFFANIL